MSSSRRLKSSRPSATQSLKPGCLLDGWRMHQSSQCTCQQKHSTMRAVRAGEARITSSEADANSACRSTNPAVASRALSDAMGGCHPFRGRCVRRRCRFIRCRRDMTSVGGTCRWRYGRKSPCPCPPAPPAIRPRPTLLPGGLGNPAAGAVVVQSRCSHQGLHVVASSSQHRILDRQTRRRLDAEAEPPSRDAARLDTDKMLLFRTGPRDQPCLLGFRDVFVATYRTSDS